MKKTKRNHPWRRRHYKTHENKGISREGPKLEDAGITLIALILTIILMIILGGIGIYTGTEIMQASRITRFSTEMKMVQQRVNEIYTEIQAGNTTYYQTGKELTNLLPMAQDKIEKAFTAENIQEIDKKNFRYFDEGDLAEIGIEGVSQDVLINLYNRMVISVEGIEKENVTYYTESSLNGEYYNVDYNATPNIGNIEYNVQVEKNENKWKITLTNIIYPGYINSGTVWYKLETDTNWIKAKEYSFQVYETGTYDIKLIDSAGNEKQVKQMIGS